MFQFSMFHGHGHESVLVCLILPHHCCNTAATVDWSKSSPGHDCTVARLSLCSGCLSLSSVRDTRVGHVPARACMFVISDLCWWFDKLISDESCFQAVVCDANMQSVRLRLQSLW